jgi:hypothetical protein
MADETYEGPIAPSFDEVRAALEADEESFSNYLSDFESQHSDAGGAVNAKNFLLTEEALTNIQTQITSGKVQKIYESLFYGQMRPVFTIPEIFSPEDPQTYMEALSSADISAEEANMKSAKMAFLQAIVLCQYFTTV